MVILSGSNYEQSLLHILENMVPKAVSDAEMILHTMICCRGIMRWDGRRRLIVDGHTLPGTDLAELLEYAVLPYHKDIPKPQGIDSFTKGLSRIGAEPRHISAYVWLLKQEMIHNMHWNLSMIVKKSLMWIV